MSIPAIETSYKGYHFRSRLEARWAVFFDSLGIDWEYEKEGFELQSGRYLPDFWIPFRRHANHHGDVDSGYWLEIKGTDPTEPELTKCLELAQTTGHTTLLVYGSPTSEAFHTYSFSPTRKNGEIIGVSKHHSKEPDPHLQKFYDGLKKTNPTEESFYSHGDLAFRFLHGQEKEYDQQTLVTAIINTRSARFEHGENGA